MRKSRILPDLTAENFTDWTNPVSPLISEKEDLRVTIFPSGDYLTLAELGNAFRRGTSSKTFHLRFVDGDAYGLILRAKTIGQLWEELSAHEAGTSDRRVTLHGCTFDFSVGTTQSIRTFSPTHLDRLKPLRSEPRKWTIAHVIRALTNANVHGLRCTGRYTDDYAHDAAINFGRDQEVDPLLLAKELTTDPSGWRVWTADGRVHLTLFSFRSYTFHFSPTKS